MPKLGMDVGFQGASGSRLDIAKLSRMTHLRHDDQSALPGTMVINNLGFDCKSDPNASLP
jgi:hypothetical protein